jgi:hypothetical protein
LWLVEAAADLDAAAVSNNSFLLLVVFGTLQAQSWSRSHDAAGGTGRILVSHFAAGGSPFEVPLVLVIDCCTSLNNSTVFVLFLGDGKNP